MMVRVAHFPKHAPIPVGFQRGAAFPGLATDEACRVLYDLPIVEESASLCQIAVIARRMGHLPGVNNLSLDVDEINLTATTLRREQGKAFRGSVRV